jgi:hypothetical protein
MTTLAFDGSQDGTPVGYYTYVVGEDRWSWSAGVYALHGYEPDSVAVTSELMLQHKHPDDMPRAFEVLQTAIQDGRPFACYHRVIDAKQAVRSVVSVGRGVAGPDGTIEQVTGFFVDLTDARSAETQRGVDEALVAIAQTRSIIDQAKGMVMLGMGCDADTAFGVLRKYSSHKNVKLNDLARRLVTAVESRIVPEENACRTAVTSFLDGLKSFSRPEASST